MSEVVNTPAPQAQATAQPAPAGAPGALAQAPSPAEFIPEKFRVTNESGVDLEASARKMAESYGRLETRFRNGDVPPSAPTEYQIEVPEELREHWKEDDRFAAFREGALQVGLTQAQMDFVMEKYFAIAPQLMGGAAPATVEAVSTDLNQAWGEGAAYEKQFNLANRAFEAFADPQDRGNFDSIMTNPAIAYRILAKIGPELAEAGGIPADAGTAAQASIKALLTSEANTNPRHPDHAATRAKINAHYSRVYGNELAI